MDGFYVYLPNSFCCDSMPPGHFRKGETGETFPDYGGGSLVLIEIRSFQWDVGDALHPFPRDRILAPEFVKWHTGLDSLPDCIITFGKMFRPLGLTRLECFHLLG